MFVIPETTELEADLAAGRLCCPGCERPLSRWGFAREREIRMLDGVRSLRARRARCAACQTTHAITPAWSLPRRRDSAEVIGHALLAKSHGDGHRTIARRLERPAGTVRGWLRAFAGRAELVTATAHRWTRAVSMSFEPAKPSGSSVTDAVEALASAVREFRLHVSARAGPWELAVALTGGLLSGSPRDPPGLSSG
ncbi:MAG: DUF6431 domain-containing protein [Solirubrobacteraceae bacterium]|jgi:hypothetical protein